MTRAPYLSIVKTPLDEALRASEEGFYLSNDRDLDLASSETGLSPDEILGLVGVFHKGHRLSGLPKGELVKGLDGAVTIRHHFTKKTLWRRE